MTSDVQMTMYSIWLAVCYTDIRETIFSALGDRAIHSERSGDETASVVRIPIFTTQGVTGTYKLH